MKKPRNMKLRMDKNGNKTLYVRQPRLKIQTNGNLLKTHRDGIGPWTPEEVQNHLRAIGKL